MGTRVLTMLEPSWQGLPPIDPAAISGSVSCVLPPAYESVGGARRFTRETLLRWDLDEIFDSVALVVSELVTNALRHAMPKAAATGSAAVTGVAIGAGPGTNGAPPQTRLHLMLWSSRLVCAVRDPSDDRPVAGEADYSAESGRGLYLVDAFSDNWGWHPLAGATHGKVVWALFRLPQARTR